MLSFVCLFVVCLSFGCRLSSVVCLSLCFVCLFVSVCLSVSSSCLFVICHSSRDYHLTAECLSVCLLVSFCLLVCISFCLSLCHMSFYWTVCLLVVCMSVSYVYAFIWWQSVVCFSVYLFVFLFVGLSICLLSVCLSVCPLLLSAISPSVIRLSFCCLSVVYFSILITIRP